MTSFDGLVRRLRRAGCVFAEDEARILREIASADDLDTAIQRRIAGEPLETVVGWVAFCGVRLVVEPGVFVPRQRTGLLAELAVAAARTCGLPTVLDLCCGTGAVGAAVASALPDASIWAADLDPVAVACARRNLPINKVVCGDLYAPLPSVLRGRLDVIAANAPYVPTDRITMMPREARDFEPLLALDGGPDGLDVQRRLIAEAPEWLDPGGVLLLETSTSQAPVTAGLVRAAGFTAEVLIDDDRDATVVHGTLR